jgi:hypothetical protein
MKTSFSALVLTALVATFGSASLAQAADRGLGGALISGADAPALPPPVELGGPGPVPPPGPYVPVAPPGMVTYPGYMAAYPSTACRGAYWARRPIFNADGLLVGYSRPQYVCPNMY